MEAIEPETKAETKTIRKPFVTMEGKRFYVLGLGLHVTDVFILAVLLFFNILTAIFHFRVEGWQRMILKNTGIALLYLLFVYLHQIASSRVLKFILRTASIQLLLAHLFVAVHPLQLILFSEWKDPVVLNFEKLVFGLQPTVWFQKFMSPALTEWMMFSYVIYVPIYPVLCGIIYFKRGPHQMEDYLFTLGVTNVLCDIGFILFPVAGPLYAIKPLYTVPLKGYFFTFWGEYIRTHVHSIGGCIPSPHCAVATIMWLMAYRYHKPSFYVLTPIILSLYVSAAYGRYHYVTDVVIGILTALLAVGLATRLVKGWNRVVLKWQPENP
ncbi:MAG: phosphatase PAP2 family protein [Candidatus Aminicenantales bacterium]